MTDANALFWEELETRGFIANSSDLDGLKERTKHPLTLYIGADATAKSFHVGHLVFFMLLKWFKKQGHQVILLLGGGTTRVGDPSDKKSARPLLAAGEIDANLMRLSATVKRLLGEDAQIVNNEDWLCKLNYIDFLRDIGRHFSVNRMMSFDFIKRRLESNQPLSFLEMNYLLMQSYDFLELYDRYGCTLQLGGQDQWANIISGVELIRRTREKQAYALTYPLLTNAAGDKMGKTGEGTIWLDPEFLTPYDFWQFWRNVDDASVGRFLRMLTFLPLEEIKVLEAAEGQAINGAKEVLADQITTFVHGSECLPGIHKTAASFFKGAPDADATHRDFFLTAEALEPGTSILDLLQTVGFVSSKGEARRLIRGGAVVLGGTTIEDEKFIIDTSAFNGEARLRLAAGKKKQIWVCRA